MSESAGQALTERSDLAPFAVANLCPFLSFPEFYCFLLPKACPERSQAKSNGFYFLLLPSGSVAARNRLRRIQPNPFDQVDKAGIIAQGLRTRIERDGC